MAAKRSGDKTALKVVLGVVIALAVLFLLFLLIVVFGILLPQADPNLAMIQPYIDWSNDTLEVLGNNIQVITVLLSLLGGTGVVTYLALKNK